MNNEVQSGKPGKNYEIQVNGKTLSFQEPKVTGRQILEKAHLHPPECHTLYEKLKDCDFEKISLDELVDISRPGLERFMTKEPEVFYYTIDKEPETTDSKTLSPTEILKLAGIDPADRYLVQVLSSGEKIVYAFLPNEPIKMLCPSMIFVTEQWVKLVDIEEFGKQCKEVPPALQYKIKVDKSYHVINFPFVSGRQLIELEKKQPVDKFDVFAFFCNQPKPKKVGLDEKFDLRQKCLVRFVLQPKEQQDGKGNRKDFSLPQEDVDFLNGLALHWETVSVGGLWLIVYDYPIPEGYNVTVAEVALMIAPNYPASEIDMVYFYPQLQKKSGRRINAITPQPIDGRIFQRWSRHRKPGEWRPGIDDISTHLALVENWILKDLNR